MSQEQTANLGADAPLNELECSLFSLMSGQITHQDFLRVFLQSRLFIMVDGQPEGDTLGDKRPMVIASAPEAPRMLAVFSDPVRAEKLVTKFHEYSFPIMVDCEWALECLGPHMGLAFNPGCHYGFEIAPEGAQELRSALHALRDVAGGGQPASES